jgi:hypothetical protein
MTGVRAGHRDRRRGRLRHPGRLHPARGGWDGPVIQVGAEPSLPYERPPLSKTLLIARCAVPDPAALADPAIALKALLCSP